LIIVLETLRRPADVSTLFQTQPFAPIPTSG
jgi:hypothetical protein